jgi:hypothetical protein
VGPHGAAALWAHEWQGACCLSNEPGVSCLRGLRRYGEPAKVSGRGSAWEGSPHRGTASLRLDVEGGTEGSRHPRRRCLSNRPAARCRRQVIRARGGCGARGLRRRIERGRGPAGRGAGRPGARPAAPERGGSAAVPRTCRWRSDHGHGGGERSQRVSGRTPRPGRNLMAAQGGKAREQTLALEGCSWQRAWV